MARQKRPTTENINGNSHNFDQEYDADAKRMDEEAIRDKLEY